MIRKLPIIPTLIVLVAVGIMVRLGFWQIERLHQKEAMLAIFAANSSDRGVHRWSDGDLAAMAYGRVSGECMKVQTISAQAGRNAQSTPGWVQVADCNMVGVSPAQVVLGWSLEPTAVKWNGGQFSGIYVPRDKDKGGAIIVADPALAGLQPNARPDPRTIPNNHLAYAVQWFLFAGVALVIYALAVRKRLRG
jgi:surfeit locus 1 family protein